MVSGSISSDYLHHFPGRFADHIVPGGLDRLSSSFLADELTTHWAASVRTLLSVWACSVAGRCSSAPPGRISVVIGANDPEAMLAHTRQAKTLGLPFAADPSQQLPRLNRQTCRELVEGASYLFSNEYEGLLIRRVCGWTEPELMSQVGLRVTTLAGEGCELADVSGERARIPAVPPAGPVEPTGAGDGFRAGFLAGIDHGLAPRQAAQLGCLIATLVLETSGSQTWRIDREDAVVRLRETYGAAESAESADVLNAALFDAAAAG